MCDALYVQGSNFKDVSCFEDHSAVTYLVADLTPFSGSMLKILRLKKGFMDRFIRDTLKARQCWYKSRYLNFQYEANIYLPEDRDRVKVPVLFMGAKEDPIFRPKPLISLIEAGLLATLEHLFSFS